MGLGLHGGGVATARFLANSGCSVIVTDLQSEDVLAPSLAMLADLPIRFVLGTHEENDFRTADFVVKNPAVPIDAPLLTRAKRIETDISLFLSISESRIIAVTGSKGKSSTASAIHHALLGVHGDAKLGGNIATSPLEFLDEESRDPIVLELSSWQLADLRGRDLLKPDVSVVLNLLRDHQNRYSDLESYAADKQVICESQDTGQTCVLNFDDEWVRGFASSTRASIVALSRTPEITGGGESDGVRRWSGRAWLDGELGFDTLTGKPMPNIGAKLGVPGDHSRFNLLAAAAALIRFGVDREIACRRLESFPGIRHRLETISTKAGVRFVNDTTATIPDATVAAVSSYDLPIHLIAGGTDKNLDFTVLEGLSVSSAHFLEGNATQRMIEAVRRSVPHIFGPFDTLDAALSSAVEVAGPGSIVLFSPGCTSFEMFKNEFDRGDKFREAVNELPG